MIHLGERFANNGRLIAVCGASGDNILLTEDRAEVTCRKCRRAFHAKTNNKDIFYGKKQKNFNEKANPKRNKVLERKLSSEVKDEGSV